MGAFILFLLFLFLMIVLSVISFGLSVIRGVFGLFFPGKRRTSESFAGGHGYSEPRDFGPQSGDSGRNNKKKIFDKTEGEYVDYEEVSK